MVGNKLWILMKFHLHHFVKYRPPPWIQGLLRVEHSCNMEMHIRLQIRLVFSFYYNCLVIAYSFTAFWHTPVIVSCIIEWHIKSVDYYMLLVFRVSTPTTSNNAEKSTLQCERLHYSGYVVCDCGNWKNPNKENAFYCYVLYCYLSIGDDFVKTHIKHSKTTCFSIWSNQTHS